MFLLEVFLLLKIIQRKSEKDFKNFLNTFPMTIKITDMTMFSNYCSFYEFQFLIYVQATYFAKSFLKGHLS